MLFYSTNNNADKVDFREATINGQAPDKGLYFPETIPSLSENFINDIEKISKEEIALKVIQPYVADTMPQMELQRIVKETIDFNFLLVPLTESISSLELFHGPTLAFKDVGARFMSRCLGYFMQNNSKKITVLVATSGDTGSAVANGFYGVDGINVIILYPSGKVSNIQELQLTTLEKNITALEVDGSFDDCQQLVKQAFADKDIQSKLSLTSANSINVARWLPQQFYYFFAYQQWNKKNGEPVISVPSGNFGNICAGLLSYCSGLPAQHFIAACNANDIVSQYLETGNYSPRKSIPTISNAMDVGNPSNFIRILELFQHKLSSLKNILTSYSISDNDTRSTMKEVFQKTNYVLDPHGAVAYSALNKYLQNHNEQKGLFLETAHPVKFYDTVKKIIDRDIELPQSIADLISKEKKSISIPVDYKNFKEYLLALKN